MKSLFSKIISIFKKNSQEEFHFNDMHRACRSASEELGSYCKMEGLNR